jgi:hypothetical protein
VEVSVPDLDERLRDALGSVDGDWETTPARRVRLLAAVHHQQRRRRQAVLASAAVIAAAAVVTGVTLRGGGPGTTSAARTPHQAARDAGGSAAPAAPSASAATAAPAAACPAKVRIGSGPARCAGSIAAGPTAFASQDLQNNAAAEAAPVTVPIGARFTVTLPAASAPTLAWTVPAPTQPGLGRAGGRGPSASGSTSATFVARHQGTSVVAASELTRCRTGVCGAPVATYTLDIEVNR